MPTFGEDHEDRKVFKINKMRVRTMMTLRTNLHNDTWSDDLTSVVEERVHELRRLASQRIGSMACLVIWRLSYSSVT